MAGERRIGLALAGGGPQGAIYEIGALRALDEVLEGADTHLLDIYVGVSAGAFVASCLVNGMTSEQLCRATFASRSSGLPFDSEMLFRPAIGEWMRRAMTTPALAFDAIRDYLSNPGDESPLAAMTRLSRALPLGLFDNEPLRAYLERAFSTGGRTDRFDELTAKLFVIASDLDSGRAVRFGEAGMDQVPISRAVQASSALPGLYPPVEIDGRHYVDGVLLKTVHASVALDHGAQLVFCVNPIVPVDTSDSVAEGAMRRGKLVHRGLPTVLAQTFRTLVHSRLVTGMASYEGRYPGTDLILLEPEREDYRMFFTNIFKMSNRRAVCEHAYRSTRRQLWRRRDELEPILARHGLRLCTELLGDERELEPSLGIRAHSRAALTDDLNSALSRLEALLG